jgi:hypothetical protein
MWRQPHSAVSPAEARQDFAGTRTEPNFADRESFYYKCQVTEVLRAPAGPVLPKLSIRDFYFRVSSGLCCIHRRDDLWNRRLDQSPSASAQNHNGDLATCKFLLVGNVPVGGEQQVESGSSAALSNSPFVSRSQPSALASLTSCPREWASPLGVPLSKRMSISRMSISVRGRSIQAAGREFHNCLDLFRCDGELFDDLLDGHAVFQIFEHGGYRHPRAAEDPCTTHFTRDTLDVGAFRPIKWHKPSNPHRCLT